MALYELISHILCYNVCDNEIKNMKVISNLMCMMCDFNASIHEGRDVSVDGQVVAHKDTFWYLGSMLQNEHINDIIKQVHQCA